MSTVEARKEVFFFFFCGARMSAAVRIQSGLREGEDAPKRGTLPDYTLERKELGLLKLAEKLNLLSLAENVAQLKDA